MTACVICESLTMDDQYITWLYKYISKCTDCIIKYMTWTSFFTYIIWSKVLHLKIIKLWNPPWVSASDHGDLPLQWQSASTKSFPVILFQRARSAGAQLPDVASLVKVIVLPSWVLAEHPLTRFRFPLPNVIMLPWSSWHVDHEFQFWNWANSWTQVSSCVWFKYECNGFLKWLYYR